MKMWQGRQKRHGRKLSNGTKEIQKGKKLSSPSLLFYRTVSVSIAIEPFISLPFSALLGSGYLKTSHVITKR